MRYKEFSPNAILEKCIIQFWSTGFRGTSIGDVVGLTGVNRFSLYEEFGNKEGLLLAALRLYQERYSWGHIQILSQKGEIEHLLKEFYMSFLKDQKQAGCFVIHVGVELAESDQDVKQFLESYILDIKNQIIQLLERRYTYDEANFYARQLIGLYYTSMSFCLIHSETYRVQHIKNGINVILTKNISHA